MAEETAVIRNRVLEILVVRAEPGEEERPIRAEAPIGVGVATPHPHDVLLTLFGTGVAVHADFRTYESRRAGLLTTDRASEEIYLDRCNVSVVSPQESHLPRFLQAGEFVDANWDQIIRSELAQPKTVSFSPHLHRKSASEVVDSYVLLEP
jgi:hypothetical protein